MAVEVIFYQEEDGACPVIEFFDGLSVKPLQTAYGRMALLKDYGHTLHRPYAENIGQGLYELRWHTGRVQYRIFYFFHGQEAVVLAHAFTKEDKIPPADFNRAFRRKLLFEQNPKKHTYPGELL